MQEQLSTTSQAQAAFDSKKVRALRWWIALIVVVATLLEGLVCNHFYFRYAWGDYQPVTVDLPYLEQLKEHAYVFSPQQKSLVLSGLDLDMMTLGFKLKGEHSIISGAVNVTDESSIIRPLPTVTFKVAPADISVYDNDFTRTPAAPVKLLVRGQGKIHSVIITLNNVQGAVVLTDLTLNVKPTYSFSLLRWLGLVLVGLAFLGLVRQRWYQLRLGDLSRKGFRLVQGASLALCLALSLGYGYLMLPSHMGPHLTYDYLEKGYNFLGNPEYSLLLDFPQTQHDVDYHDPYVQNLDAWLKGQLNIDVAIDTDFLNAQHDEHLFDFGWRMQQGIEGYLDHSFYNGKFYVYYGYGPTLVFYLPLYLITGCAPSPTLAVTFFSVVAILGLYLGTFALARFYGILPRANVLVWGLGQAAAVLGTHLLLVQSMLTFYSYAPLLAAGMLGLVTYLSYTIPRLESTFKKRLALGGISLLIVLIVHTRPFMLVPALAICCPIFWCMVKASWAKQTEQARAASDYGRRDMLLDALCVGVPVTIGAIITMVLNYLRFDSIWDFGQRLCIAVENLQANTFQLHLELISATLQMFITRPWVESADFPFYSILHDWPHHAGFYLPGEFCVGLLASPVWWGLALIVVLFMTRHQPQVSAGSGLRGLTCGDRYGINQERLLKISLILLVVVTVVVWYVDFISTASSARYTMESGAALVAFLVLLWVKFIDYTPVASLQAKICYWAALWAFVMSIVMESFAPFGLIEQNMPYLVPDEWVSAQDFFTPLSTLR